MDNLKSDNIYDVVIIGSGPAGLSASIYATRAMLKCVTIEKQYMSGGQILNTYEVDNYPGLPNINGFDMGQTFRKHAEKLGAEFIKDEVIEICDENNLKKIKCKKETFLAKAIIVSTGATHRHLGVKGEKKLYAKGVSYCATCDGAFYKDKITAVIGGGDVALEDAIFLSRHCKKVYLIHRRDKLRGAKTLQEKLFSLPNVEILWDRVVEEIKGDDEVSALSIKNLKTDDIYNLDVNGVFIAIGILPNSSILDGYVELDKNGYVIAGENAKTSVKGVFASGDVRTKDLRQVVTAVSDGANAITSVEKYLNENFL